MTTLRLLTLALALGGGPLVHAQSADAPAPRLPTHRMHGVLVASLDTNHDGVLSRAEIEHAPTVLRALDRNGDGVLSTDELRRFELSRPGTAPESAAARTNRPGRSLSGFVVAFALDANHDGEIQMMEIANAALSLRSLDLNGDGQLTAAELRREAVAALTGQ